MAVDDQRELVLLMRVAIPLLFVEEAFLSVEGRRLAEGEHGQRVARQPGGRWRVVLVLRDGAAVLHQLKLNLLQRNKGVTRFYF